MEKIEHISKGVKMKEDLQAILKQHFGHCFNKEGLFDFEKFKKELKDQDTDFSRESYSMDWLGKSYARLLAVDEATTLLKEDKLHNTLPENQGSQNLLIKGDNLEVLKHLSNAYYEKVKMIYIDPPYNTGSDGFVYNDTRKFTPDELVRLAAVSPEEAKRILDFTQSKSNSHSAWLTFMYPRLYIARRLLRQDGVIFVSIDDNEVAQLRLLMDEIFGGENFAGMMTRKQSSGSKNDSNKDKIIATADYLLIYRKTDFSFLSIKKENKKSYSYQDEKGKFSIRALEMQGGGDTLPQRPKMGYSIYYKQSTNDVKLLFDYNLNNKEVYDIPNQELIADGYKCYRPRLRGDMALGIWRWGDATFLKRFSENGVYFDDERVYLKERESKIINKYPDAILDMFLNTQGTNELKELFPEKVFSFPKPTNLIKYLLQIATNSDANDIVLDFFAGSGTTGDAVMQLNAEDGGNRQFILVQLPEEIDQKKSKTAYDFVLSLRESEGREKPTIFEITKERLLRSANKLKGEKDLFREDLDLGFQIYETSPIWEGYDFEADVLSEELRFFDVSLLTDADLDTLLTTWKTYDGLPLTKALNKLSFAGYTGYFAERKLYLVHQGFTTDMLQAILKEIDENEAFSPNQIIVFGYHFESKSLRELSENLKSYANKKNAEIELIVRY